MVLSKYWGELNPAPEGVIYNIKEATTRKKSGLVVVREEILVSFRPAAPLEFIEVTFDIVKGPSDED